ncbi:MULTISPECIES: hypothetical protein [Flavobacterium]|uniref:hypothetical protein n=1 Tax=Flavobacterium TaxID=237 RepID=UPI0011EC945E|nr:hypothetical protein [Flavobacterium johnsoniae]
MRIIENLLEWLENQNTNSRDTVLFQILMLAPDYDLTKFNYTTDNFLNFKEYLNNDTGDTKKIGKLIYIINAINFTVLDYDEIDNLIDSQVLLKDIIVSGESEGKDMSYLRQIHINGGENFEAKKEFKNNWIEYRDENLKFEILNKILKNSLLDKK